ncbi:MAG: acyl-CoA dehydrogenase family protein, partial [Hyphomicrobiaceae bacterium]
MNAAREAVSRILQDLCDPAAVNTAADDAWKAPLWSTLEQAGMTLAWVPAELGGAGAGLADGFDILYAAGRFAVAVPLAETLLAGWLLAEAGLTSPAGPMSIAPVRDNDRIVLADGVLTGLAHSVPFAREARHFAVLANRENGSAVVAVAAAADLPMTEGKTIAGDTVGDVSFHNVAPVA